MTNQSLSILFRKYSDVIYVLLLIALNVYIKSKFIGSQEIVLDEPFSIYHSQASVKDIFQMLPHENNPPLYFILLHFWIKIAGTSPIATRIPSMLFSALAVVFIYGIGRKKYSAFVGLGAALIYTFSNLNMLHAHDTRVYTLFVFLTVMSMYYFILYIDNPRAKYFWLFTVANILLPYAHFFGFFVISLQFVHTLFIPAVRKSIFKKYVVSMLIVFIAYVPYLYIFLSRFLHSSGGTWVPKPHFSNLYDQLWAFSNGPVNMVFFMILIVVAIILLIKRKEKPSKYTIIIFTWFVGPYLFMYFISFLMPMFIDRYLIYITPGYYLTLAVASDKIGGKRRWVSYILMSVCIVVMAIKVNLNMNNGRYPSKVVKLVKELQTDNTPVYMCPPWIDLTIAYYYDRKAFDDYGNLEKKLNQENVFPLYSKAQMDTAQLKTASKALYIDGWSSLTDPDSTIYKILRKNFRKEKMVGNFNGYDVYLYTQ